MELEIFKDIPGYEGLYQVSNMGRIYSLPKKWISRIEINKKRVYLGSFKTEIEAAEAYQTAVKILIDLNLLNNSGN